jgi:hypothetical protein
METTGVSGENRSIWGKTGVFRENRVYGDNGRIWYTLFSLNTPVFPPDTPVFPQILLFSPDAPVVSIYSVFSKYSRFPQILYLEKTEYMETTGVSGENRSIWGKTGVSGGKTGVFRENRVYGDNRSI